MFMPHWQSSQRSKKADTSTVFQKYETVWLDRCQEMSEHPWKHWVSWFIYCPDYKDLKKITGLTPLTVVLGNQVQGSQANNLWSQSATWLVQHSGLLTPSVVLFSAISSLMRALQNTHLLYLNYLNGLHYNFLKSGTLANIGLPLSFHSNPSFYTSEAWSQLGIQLQFKW